MLERELPTNILHLFRVRDKRQCKVMFVRQLQVWGPKGFGRCVPKLLNLPKVALSRQQPPPFLNTCSVSLGVDRSSEFTWRLEIWRASWSSLLLRELNRAEQSWAEVFGFGWAALMPFRSHGPQALAGPTNLGPRMLCIWVTAHSRIPRLSEILDRFFDSRDR